VVFEPESVIEDVDFLVEIVAVYCSLGNKRTRGLLRVPFIQKELRACFVCRIEILMWMRDSIVHLS
jgi:hypothetical protein